MSDPGDAPRRNTLAGVALVLGCAALPFTAIPQAFIVSIPLGVAGTLTGVAGRRAARRRQGRGRAMATIAIVLSAFVVVLGTLGAVLVWNVGRLPP